jgi:hypothetical protein
MTGWIRNDFVSGRFWWRSGFLDCAAHRDVSGFGRNDDSWSGCEEKTAEIQAGKDRSSRNGGRNGGMIVTLGIVRCAQNDGKDLSQ